MIAQLLDDCVRRAPDRPFVLTDDGTYAYAEIARLARRFAGTLHARGVVRGEHLALIAENSAAYLVAWFGIAMLGAVTVTLNNQLVGDGLGYSLRQSDAKLIVADRAWIDAKGAMLATQGIALPIVAIESEPAFFASLADAPEREPVAAGPETTCTILYTSGTTGLPKGVMNPHGAYVATGRATARALALTAADRIMVFLPLFHVNPQMFAVMGALSAGASLALRKRFSVAAFFEDALRFAATGCTFVGTVLSILASRHPGERRDHGLRFAFGGGAPLDVWTAVEQRFGIRVHEAYGMTEIGGWTSVNTVDAYRFGSCGRPRDDIEVHIFDTEDREVATGEPGEIVVRPREPNVILSGYYNQPGQLVAASRNFWFHTGDRGSIDADGYLYFHGRTKELIRRGGEMISPVEVETALRAMPGILDCAVVGVPDAIMDEEIKAAVVAGAAVTAAAVRAFLAERLPPFMLPRYVELVTSLPKTETEKVQRHKLQYLDERVDDARAKL